MRRTGAAAAICAFLTMAPLAIAQHPSQDLMGLDVLTARLGETTPTGAGVVVAQVEAEETNPPSGDYVPLLSAADFVGKTFGPLSGASSDFPHATAVGRYQYGVIRSLAPDVTDVYNYEALHWLTTGYLKLGQSGVSPAAPPFGIKCINHSWIADFGSDSLNIEALRRADWMVTEHDILVTSGVPNDPPNAPLMAHMYNGITVGLQSLLHVADNTLGGNLDGPGRIRPDIVGPSVAFTSYSTPMANAAASVLVETARTHPDLVSNPAAERSDVLKAAILAGASHDDLTNGFFWTWSNGADTAGPLRGVTDAPIDQSVGAGIININRSHLILTGGEQDGSLTPPASTNVDWRGWDRESVDIGESRYYRFQINSTADEVSILATWHRIVHLLTGNPALIPAFDLADFDLVLWRVDAQGDLQSLVGDDGLPYFGGGNVVSESLIDNVEHLYVTNLQPGEYVIQLDRIDAIQFPESAFDVAVAWLLPEPAPVPEDVNGDGAVNFADILALISAWGPCVACPEDIDDDGAVTFADILLVITAWTG